MSLALHPSATACGKVIVVGEHAVVHGVPALAAGLPNALLLQATPLDDPRAPMELKIDAWDIDVRLMPQSDHAVVRACLEVLTMCDGPVTGWRIRGETSLPSRAGLGSSAALTVGIARLVLGPDADPADIVSGSLAGERIFHGNPSGIDSEVAARGGLLCFRRGEGVEPIHVPHPVPLLVVPSGVPRSTADQVAKVRSRLDRLPMLQRPALELMGVAAAEAITAIQSRNYTVLGEIFDLCHGLLGAVGVSSRILDEMCAVTRSAGALGAKLTGAGGGGCILAVPPTPSTPLLHALTEKGYAPLLVEV